MEVDIASVKLSKTHEPEVVAITVLLPLLTNSIKYIQLLVLSEFSLLLN